MALPEWQTVKVIKQIDETPMVRRYWLQFDQPFDFKAGQFITMDLPISEKKNKRMKSYSIASAPDGTNVIELIIVLVPDGEGGTRYLFNEISEGSEIVCRGPLGNFCLPETIDKDICLIATGTGIAPFRSYLLDLKNTQKPYNNIYLIFGTRTESDILYYRELTMLAATMTRVHYIPTLSRSDDTWKGLKGYVHGVYESLFADKRPAHFYLCGWKNMIDEARMRLEAMGYAKKDIHLEIYG